jgi:colanic acid/amylovoran biosynthesis glycosyltransferase
MLRPLRCYLASWAGRATVLPRTGPDEFDDAKTLAFDDKLKHAAFAIAISNYCKSQLIRFGGARHAEKIHIVHCGIDPGEFSVAPLDESEAQTLVCVGRLCANKGQTLIPGAVSRLRSAFPNLKVILVGDGEGRGDIEAAIARHGVGAHVELVGWRSNDEVRALIRKSRALVLPTFAEGLPIVIMEALAMGRPVISTYIAGIPELLDAECGWIVPAGSVDDLTAAMGAALAASPPEIARLGAEGRRRVVEGFDIDLSARALGEYFEALADSPEAASEPALMMAAPAGR